jgi:hypothetical protein
VINSALIQRWDPVPPFPYRSKDPVCDRGTLPAAGPLPARDTLPAREVLIVCETLPAAGLLPARATLPAPDAMPVPGTLRALVTNRVWRGVLAVLRFCLGAGISCGSLIIMQLAVQ